MSGFLTAVIVISAIFIVFAVIMQPSKDGGLGGLASGGVTDSVFGTNRNEFLAKTTWWLLAIFLISSLVLAKHKTREHNEREQEINTRSKVEEASEKKVVPSIEDSKKNTENKSEEIEKKVENTLEQIKKEAQELEKKAEGSKEEVKEDADKAAEDAKKALPESEK